MEPCPLLAPAGEKRSKRAKSPRRGSTAWEANSGFWSSRRQDGSCTVTRESFLESTQALATSTSVEQNVAATPILVRVIELFEKLDQFSISFSQIR